MRPVIALALTLPLLGCGGGRASTDEPPGGGEAGAAGGATAKGEPGSGDPETEAEEDEAREPLAAFMARFEREAEAEAPRPSPADAGQCPKRGERDRDVGLVISPEHPAKGEEVRVLAATLDGEAPLAVRIEVDGEPVSAELEVRAGVPASTLARFVPADSGRVQVIVGREGEGLRCQSFGVRNRHYSDDSPVDLTVTWPVDRAWTASEEALYSAWIRELFAGPADQDLAWGALSEVTSDPERNLLHDHLGRGEDHPSQGMELIPDCADTPYFLRAYWSYKRGLPFGFRKCSRGRGQAPTCFDLRTNLAAPDRRNNWIDPPPPEGEEPPAQPPSIAGFGAPEPEPPPDAVVPTHNEKYEYFFKRTVGWGVHTGNGRTAYGDSDSDFYPVALDRRGLRPGIIYADPYGHILVLVELVAPRGSAPGILFAIDGQPDGSITRKRFWEGNFLWNQADSSLGGSGFKAFRPLSVIDGSASALVQVSDETIADMRSYGDVSDMQQALSATDFYDLMERLITPGVRSPFAAQAELVAALAEAVRVRVTSVENGVRWHEQNPDDLVEMPWGHDVFETSGAWENYSTPARDLRLLIAMDVVLGFADKVRRNPESFGLDPQGDPELFERTFNYLEEQRGQLLADPKYAISYERSDGSAWELGLDEVVARAERFEIAYNPNDCPEVRWGAPEGSEERKSCDRRAPEDQQIKMRYYRTWFEERRRPARGDEGPEIPELAEAQVAAREAD
ncbi:hypothetical protein G6O69_18830 [Pseudenhygromyxa sp. WMMC2535]|uniref:hypothetical protein n=1 Tax=Pseudenhygromyxa sp. WMMC2535 TaxID=2712867 RepID=UPI001556B71E|nr:hypothetical protein [Pseudenhygromyxa sp. WMMC2535]NVB39906.1 hypothetical protein [Pseudenhygromyxa sp. WMMC2535]